MNSALAALAAALKAPPPWLTPYLSVARQTVQGADSQSVADALNAVRDAAAGTPRFVAQSLLPPGEPYEGFIARTACVPTRDNLHDLLNGLMWQTYPKTKRRLNALQSREIALHGASGARGSLRDALTVFDENAAILQAPPALIEALRHRDWSALFLKHREQWARAHLAIFGHALMEKLLQPRKPITAHVWLVEEVTDEAIAASLDPGRLAAKDFLPLPVLGVPGWWPANENPGFYDDPEVFRSRREGRF